MTLEETILDFITHGRGVSFVELMQIDGFEGDQVMVNGTHPSVIYWVGLSMDAIHALVNLLKTNKIKMVPTSALVYMCDGRVLKLPVLKSKAIPRKDRWLPVVFNPV